MLNYQRVSVWGTWFRIFLRLCNSLFFPLLESSNADRWQWYERCDSWVSHVDLDCCPYHDPVCEILPWRIQRTGAWTSHLCQRSSTCNYIFSNWWTHCSATTEQLCSLHKEASKEQTCYARRLIRVCAGSICVLCICDLHPPPVRFDGGLSHASRRKLYCIPTWRGHQSSPSCRCFTLWDLVSQRVYIYHRNSIPSGKLT